MHNAFIKDCFRQIKTTFHRFISILIISALGVAFFAGLRTTGEDMRITADEYYDKQNFFDIHLLSSYGFNNTDIQSIREISGIENLDASYSMDALAKTKEISLTVKLHSYDDNSKINLPLLTEGRMPDKSGECLADPKLMKASGCSIGDTITLSSGNNKAITDSIVMENYTIVGIAQYPLYITHDRGSSKIGSGDTDAFLIIPYNDFSLSVYTDIYATINNPDGVSRFDEGYKKLLEPVVEQIKKDGTIRSDVRFKEITEETQKEIETGKSKVADGYAELDEGQKQLENARAGLDNGWTEYQKNKTDFEKQTDAARQELDNGILAYEKGLASYNSGKALYDTLEFLFANGNNNDIANISIQLKDAQPELAAILSAYASDPDNENNRTAAQTAISQFGFSLKQNKATLEQSKQELTVSRNKLEQSVTQGQEKLDKALETLNNSESEYKVSESEFNDKKQKALSDLADAEAEIADAQSALSELTFKNWYVLDLNTNVGFIGFKQDTDRIDAISLVIPLLFFMIAVLVNMTSMTRLVESERSYIGTLKAIGYSNSAIALRYLMYAVSASVTGGLAGLIIGYNTFPRVIYDAYGILYTLPPINIVYSNLYSFASVGSAVLCAALPAYFVCFKSLKAPAAELMRPVSPKIGKRTVIEKIKPLWNRFNFSQKVAFRNLFRYKKRLIMTLIGVAGCTALMFTGFGLRDSITTIVEKQYTELHRYDLQIFYSKNKNNDTERLIESNLSVSDYTLVSSEPCDVVSKSKTTAVNLVVPNDTGRFDSFIHLRDRRTKTPLSINEGAVISEKLASLYGLSTGDTFTVRDSDGTEAVLTVGGITENYLLHYIYISPDYYQTVFAQKAVPNEALCTAIDGTDYEKLAESFLSDSAISSVTIAANLKNNFSKMTDALHYVVFVLIVSAAILVFVVLFSLNTINLEERKRELATIKVLGFFNNELAAYLYRENAVLTVFGTVLGLGLGVLLQRYIITTMEVDMVMFSRDLLFPSFLYSAVLTIVFALIVNLIMLKSIAEIDVVSSMKSIE